MGVGGQRHAPAALHSIPAVGPEWNGRKNFFFTGLRIPDRLPRSELQMSAVHFSKSPMRDM